MMREIKAVKKYILWFNDFQEHNCRGCKFATVKKIGVKELCCKKLYTRIENGICLDKEEGNHE